MSKTIQKNVEITTPLSLPKDFVFFNHQNKYLGVSTAKASWVVLDSLSCFKIFKQLIAGENIQNIIDNSNEEENVLLNNIKIVLTEIFDKKFLELDNTNKKNKFVLQTLTLNITNECNLRCITCYRLCGEKTVEIDFSFWTKIVNNFAKNGGKILRISGGEPLHNHKEITFKLIKLAKSLNLQVLLLTNGTLIDKEVASILESLNIDRIQISLDGPDKHSNDLIRGKGSFDKVNEALKNLATTDIEIYLAMLPVPNLTIDSFFKNCQSFKNFIHKEISNQISISISQGLLPGRKVNRDESLCFKHQCRKLQNLYEDKNSVEGLDLWKWEPCIPIKTCGIGLSIAVEPNGDIRECAGGDVVANITKHKYSKILGILKKVANKFDVDNIDECSKCALKFLCGGPCRILPFECTDELKEDLIGRVISLNKLRYSRID